MFPFDDVIMHFEDRGFTNRRTSKFVESVVDNLREMYTIFYKWPVIVWTTDNPNLWSDMGPLLLTWISNYIH